MKKLLIFLPIFFAGTILAQNSKRADAVYEHAKEICDTVYTKSNVKIKDTVDNFIRFRTDSGNLLINIPQYESLLDERSKRAFLVKTGLRVYSLVDYLFANDLLTFDNLQQSAKKERALVSQYGDSIKYNLMFKKSDIIIQEIIYEPTIKKEFQQTFYIRLFLKDNPINVHSFSLTLIADEKIGNVTRLPKTKSKISCLTYIGYEIEGS